jgi:hypothetical protein
MSSATNLNADCAAIFVFVLQKFGASYVLLFEESFTSFGRRAGERAFASIAN